MEIKEMCSRCSCTVLLSLNAWSPVPDLSVCMSGAYKKLRGSVVLSSAGQPSLGQVSLQHGQVKLQLQRCRFTALTGGRNYRVSSNPIANGKFLFMYTLYLIMPPAFFKNRYRYWFQRPSDSVATYQYRSRIARYRPHKKMRYRGIRKEMSSLYLGPDLFYIFEARVP